MVYHILSAHKPSIALLPVHFVGQFLTLTQPLQVQLDDAPDSIEITSRGSTDVWGHNDILGAPQWVSVWQGLRVGDVQRGTTDELLVQRLYQVVGVDDGPAGDVGDKGLLLGEHLELGCRDEAGRLGRQRHRDDEEVEAGAEERVQLLGAVAEEPLGGQAPVWVPEPGRAVGVVLLRLGSLTLVQRVRIDLHAHGHGHTCCLAPYTPIPQDTAAEVPRRVRTAYPLPRNGLGELTLFA